MKEIAKLRRHFFRRVLTRGAMLFALFAWAGCDMLQAPPVSLGGENAASSDPGSSGAGGVQQPKVSFSASSIGVSASQVKAGLNANLTFVAKDEQGNQMSSGGLNVTFTLSGGSSSGFFSSTTDNGDGTYTASFTGTTAGSAAQLSVLVDGTPVTNTPPSLTVLPGNISASQSMVQVASSNIQFDSTTTVTLIAKDNYGNFLTSGGDNVVFSAVPGTGAGSVGSASDQGNGTYTAVFTGVTPGSVSVNATVNSVAFGGIAPSVNVKGVNLEVPIEMLDSGIASLTSQTLFDTSRTALDTTYYDGTVNYYLVVVASNSNASSKNIDLVDSSGATMVSVTIPGNTTNLTRYRVSFTPDVGADDYRLQLAATSSAGQLAVSSARILVRQTDAVKTRIYYPLSAASYNTLSSTVPNAIETTSSTTFTQASALNFQLWKKDLSRLSTLASTNPWTFDSILWTNNSGAPCSASLYNTSGTQVTNSQTNTTSITPALVSANFADNSTGFSDLGTFEVKIKTSSGTRTCKLAKAGLWVTLSRISKGEVYYRVEKQYASLGASTVSSNSRVLLDLSLFNKPTVSLYYETSGSATSGSSLTVRMSDHSTADSGTSSTAAVTNCAFTATDLGTTRALRRSSACTGVINGNRFINELVRTSGNVSVSSQFAVVSFQ